MAGRSSPLRRGALDRHQVEVATDVIEAQRRFYADNPDRLRGPATEPDDVDAMRAAFDAWAESTEPSARVEMVGGVPVRILDHPDPVGTVVHVHGGGWTTCRNDMWDRWLVTLRDVAGVTVVSVDYRLAPEHPYPSAIEDLAAVTAALARSDGIQRKAGPIVLVGESAGANLCAGLLVRLRSHDNDAFTAISGAVLAYGCYDLANVLPSHRAADHTTPVVSGPLLRWATAAYSAATDPHHPEISPLWADLGGMPPALVTAAENDPLIDDSILLAHRWGLAGGHAELDVYPEAVHSFDDLDTDMATIARRRKAAWVAQRCAHSEEPQRSLRADRSTLYEPANSPSV